MSISLLLLLVPVLLGVVALVVVLSTRRSHDGVDSFRRQIDALSPEARRTVVDQVQNAAGRPNGRDGDDELDDEDGVRGA